MRVLLRIRGTFLHPALQSRPPILTQENPFFKEKGVDYRINLITRFYLGKVKLVILYREDAHIHF
jgi:hypothetical protein